MFQILYWKYPHLIFLQILYWKYSYLIRFQVIAGYFLDAIKLANGCPEILRSDMGTENGTMEKMQKGLHELFDDPLSNRQSFIYGKSTHNQRIEAWWSTLRRHNSQFWMNLFQMLKEDSLFTGSFLDKSLIQFCFMALIQVSNCGWLICVHFYL